MDRLITTINQLQHYNKKYNLSPINLPEIVVIGSQSSGKSSVLERIIGRDILPKGAQVATRCPIVLQLINQKVHGQDVRDDIKATFPDEVDSEICGAERIASKLQQLTNKIGNDSEGVLERPIIIQMFSETIPTLTLIDLPGIIKNDGELKNGSVDKINNLNERYVSQPFSIILAVSSANVDLANSDSIQIARKHDPEGNRTLHVITKADIMDDGTSMLDIIRSKFIQPSLGVICVVNRSQQNVMNRRSIELAKEDELKFFQNKYRGHWREHGIDSLTNVLVKKLREQIMVTLPTMNNEISNRMSDIHDKLKILDIERNENVLRDSIVKFVTEYSNLVTGDRRMYSVELEGGAKISHLLYNVFENEMKQLSVQNLTEHNIRSAITNTYGNRKISFAIEKPFILLVRNEIIQFEKPSLECLSEVRDFLREFVSDVIKELNINEFTNFTAILEQEMQEYIQRRYRVTVEGIKNLIRCESNDVFCTHPNSHFLENLRDSVDQKFHKLKTTIFDKVVEETAKKHNITLTPEIKVLINEANRTGMLKPLKDALVPQGFSFNTFKTIVGNSANSLDATTFTNFVTDNPTLNVMVNEIDVQYVNELNNKVLERTLDEQILEEMVKEYFDGVRKNIIYYVPKWIQTLMIYDLIEEIRYGLYSIIEKDKEDLLKLDEDVENKIMSMREEIKELDEIQRNLWTIKK